MLLCEMLMHYTHNFTFQETLHVPSINPCQKLSNIDVRGFRRCEFKYGSSYTENITICITHFRAFNIYVLRL